jgi:hypothetical protein
MNDRIDAILATLLTDLEKRPSHRPGRETGQEWDNWAIHQALKEAHTAGIEAGLERAIIALTEQS